MLKLNTFLKEMNVKSFNEKKGDGKKNIIVGVNLFPEHYACIWNWATTTLFFLNYNLQ